MLMLHAQSSTRIPRAGRWSWAALMGSQGGIHLDGNGCGLTGPRLRPERVHRMLADPRGSSPAVRHDERATRVTTRDKRYITML